MEGAGKERLDAVARLVIGAAMEVQNVLGCGFLESVYEHALCVELARRGMPAARQVPLPVQYKGQRVGTYLADLVVAEGLLVELKCVDAIRKEHLAQCLNYLAATGLPLCLLINFQRPKLEWRRVVRSTQNYSRSFRVHFAAKSSSEQP